MTYGKDSLTYMNFVKQRKFVGEKRLMKRKMKIMKEETAR